ncbi:histidine kinase [Burkholderia phage BcepSauron]|uniref:Histidine kinase n=1 Tax=Burkholderia phage BcepSauron TaxID=2530033 RepID=A0A482MNS8_9CAUD|nr:histidine kinase [Burkholderia phage BcepSauron]QBQ74780.1 histidine kinase [Burkholderia phage BcepSauron]
MKSKKYEILALAHQLVIESARYDQHHFLCHAIEGAGNIMTGLSTGYFDGLHGRRLETKEQREYVQAAAELVEFVQAQIKGFMTYEGWVEDAMGLTPGTACAELTKLGRLAWLRHMMGE